MVGTTCCVPNCTNNTVKHRRLVSFHKFPEEEKLRKQWIQAINQQGEKEKFTFFGPAKTSRICGAHFNKSGFKGYLDHIPTIFSNTLSNGKGKRTILKAHTKEHNAANDENMQDETLNQQNMEIVERNDVGAEQKQGFRFEMNHTSDSTFNSTEFVMKEEIKPTPDRLRILVTEKQLIPKVKDEKFALRNGTTLSYENNGPSSQSSGHRLVKRGKILALENSNQHVVKIANATGSTDCNKDSKDKENSSFDRTESSEKRLSVLIFDEKNSGLLQSSPFYFIMEIVATSFPSLMCGVKDGNLEVLRRRRDHGRVSAANASSFPSLMCGVKDGNLEVLRRRRRDHGRVSAANASYCKLKVSPELRARFVTPFDQELCKFRCLNRVMLMKTLHNLSEKGGYVFCPGVPLSYRHEATQISTEVFFVILEKPYERMVTVNCKQWYPAPNNTLPMVLYSGISKCCYCAHAERQLKQIRQAAIDGKRE